MILINETKTKKTSITNRMLLKNQKDVDMIIKTIQNLSIEDFGKIFKLKDQALTKEYQKYHNPTLIGRAFTSYNGLMYKQLSHNYNNEELKFIEENLLIISTLQGIITPFTNIYDLRLDFTNKIGLDLTKIHNLSLNERIVNLTSKEYYTKMDLANRIDILFLEENLKEKSTYAKIYRGKMLEHLIKCQSDSFEAITSFKDDNYQYDPNLSTENKIVFIRIK